MYEVFKKETCILCLDAHCKDNIKGDEPTSEKIQCFIFERIILVVLNETF